MNRSEYNGKQPLTEMKRKPNGNVLGTILMGFLLVQSVLAWAGPSFVRDGAGPAEGGADTDKTTENTHAE